jgi:hypothetical protein
VIVERIKLNQIPSLRLTVEDLKLEAKSQKPPNKKLVEYRNRLLQHMREVFDSNIPPAA